MGNAIGMLGKSACINTGFVLFIFTLSFAPTTSNALDPLPVIPYMSFQTCNGVVRYSWNLASIQNTRKVRWELKKDADFTVPNGRDPGRIASAEVNGATGSVEIDLREYGDILNGTRYFFRVVPKNRFGRDLTLRSPSARFARDITPNFQVSIDPDRPFRVMLALGNMQPQIRNCSEAFFYEVKGSRFTNQTGNEGNVIRSGIAARNTVTVPLDFPDLAKGKRLYFRVVGYSNAATVNAVDSGVGLPAVSLFSNSSAEIGRRGSGKSTILGLETRSVSISPKAAPAPQLLRVFFSIANGTRNAKEAFASDKIIVNLVKRGSATHYKVAECYKFNNAAVKWEAYSGGSTLPNTISFTEGGEKSVCVQLMNMPKGALGGLSQKKSRTIDITRLVEHSLTNFRSVYDYSRDQGFKFLGRPAVYRKSKPCTDCYMGNATIGTVGDKGCTCRYELFTNSRRLNKPWKLKGVQLPPGNRFLLRPSGDSPRTVYINTRQEERGNMFVMPYGDNIEPDRLILIGPEGADWRDAFRQ
ncbi:MAG: hypothetical protein V3S33_00835 [Gammaproteobacteria bacterium]